MYISGLGHLQIILYSIGYQCACL